MANNKKISQLPAANVLSGEELFEIVQDGVNKKALLASLATISSLTPSNGIVIEDGVIKLAPIAVGESHTFGIDAANNKYALGGWINNVNNALASPGSYVGAEYGVALSESTVHGIRATALSNSTAIGSRSTSMSAGVSTGDCSVAMAMGSTKTPYSFATGYNATYSHTDFNTPYEDDRIFEVGNGTAGNRSNSLTGLRNGNWGFGINNLTPTANIDLDGTLRIRNNAQAGYVLTSDANGNATWQAATGGGTSISGITLTTPNTIFETPINFSESGGVWSGAMTLKTQAANKVFGTTAAGLPSFITYGLQSVTDASATTTQAITAGGFNYTNTSKNNPNNAILKGTWANTSDYAIEIISGSNNNKIARFGSLTITGNNQASYGSASGMTISNNGIINITTTSSGIILNPSTQVNVNGGFVVNNTDKGSIPAPVMTKSQRNAITSPANGLQVTVTGEAGGDYLSIYNGTSWQKVQTTAD